MSMLRREHDLVANMEAFHAEHVPVTFVDDLVEAERYRALLEANGISARVDDPTRDEWHYGNLPRAIPLLVSEMHFDQASELIAREERHSERMARDEEEEEEFEDDDEEDLDDFDDDEDLDDADDEFEDDDDDDFADDDE